MASHDKTQRVEWTLEQATELAMEQMIELLDGCDDGDTVRPALVVESMRQAWAPSSTIEPFEETAGDVRVRIRDARRRLADEVEVG